MIICTGKFVFIEGYRQMFAIVRLLVDINAHKPRHPSVFETRCFYGQLHHILAFHLPAHCRILRAIQACLHERARTNPYANLSFYTRSASNSDCACAPRALTFVTYPLFELPSPPVRLLAMVQRCNTSGQDATLGRVNHFSMRPHRTN